MTHHQVEIAASDGTSLCVERWHPADTPKFVVVLVHGGAEHVGRYDRLARRFNAAGGLAFGLDHRGQGESGGPKGHVERFEEYSRDLRLVMERTAEGLPADARPDVCPWFVFGHSMGGLITLVYLLDHVRAVPLRGAIVSSPLLGLTLKVGAVKRWVGDVAARLMPKLALPTGIPAEAICRDPDVVAAYEADERRSTVVSAGWFAAMQAAIARVEREVRRVELPMHWYVGTGDRICDPDATRRAFAQLDDPEAHDQTLAEYEGYYHELHNEPAELREPVLKTVDDWIAARLG